MFHVAFSIDVEADSAEDAARRAWELLTSPEARRPVAEVMDHEGIGHVEQINLSALDEEEADEDDDEEEADAIDPHAMRLRYNEDGLLWDEGLPDNHNVLGTMPLDYAVLFAAAPELLATVENMMSLALAYGAPDSHVSLAKAALAIAKATGDTR